MSAWVSIIAAVLSILAFFIKRLGAAEQRQLGENDAFRKSMATIIERSGVAKKISADLHHASADDIYDILRDDFAK